MKKLIVFAFVALASFAIAGCGSSSTTTPAPKTDPSKVEKPAADAAKDDAAKTPETTK
ncbi:MAG: YgdI/YgdR family lipoprotein [Planctomycetaceae bacterium]|jgi:hypothetical protein|nr:YgdI/YgdR family lipoprotein [Planctomycetaceae bacterium]